MNLIIILVRLSKTTEMIMRFFLCLFLLNIFTSCNDNSLTQSVDLIITNARIYSVDDDFTIYSSMAISDGKIVGLHQKNSSLDHYDSDEIIDLKGKAVYPGFIDAHAHLYHLGMLLQQVDLSKTTSFNEVVDEVIRYQKEHNSSYIIGHGWDQNTWKNKKFPTKDTLDVLFPDTPVALSRIDGHAMLCNSAALEKAKITIKTESDKGKIVKQNNQLTGILIDSPMQKVFNTFPEFSKSTATKALQDAEKIAFENGLTSITDAGLSRKIIDLIAEMQQSDDLKIRINAMLAYNAETLQDDLNQDLIKTDRLQVNSIKVYADGALGSRGAALHEPYSDHENHFGSLLISHQEFKNLAVKVAKSKYQLNTHAIGDAANSMVLQVYDSLLKDRPNRRWRIEHAQVLNPADIELFSTNILPSVQPTHALSDINWAEKRLGKTRLKNAYAYKKLLNQTGVLPLGTDFPVEQVNPLRTFFAAVSNKNFYGKPLKKYYQDQIISRKQALKGMTIWAAFAAFEEKEKGSLAIGKWADFVVLDQDIMKVDLEKLLSTKVLFTFLAGEQVY